MSHAPFRHSNHRPDTWTTWSEETQQNGLLDTLSLHLKREKQKEIKIHSFFLLWFLHFQPLSPLIMFDLLSMRETGHSNYLDKQNRALSSFSLFGYLPDSSLWSGLNRVFRHLQWDFESQALYIRNQNEHWYVTLSTTSVRQSLPKIKDSGLSLQSRHQRNTEDRRLEEQKSAMMWCKVSPARKTCSPFTYLSDRKQTCRNYEAKSYWANTDGILDHQIIRS